jgi:hypothetical protein
MQIIFDVTEKEKKIIDAMCEFLSVNSEKELIEKLLRDKWAEIKSPKPVNIPALAEIGIKKIVEYAIKRR